MLLADIFPMRKLICRFRANVTGFMVIRIQMVNLPYVLHVLFHWTLGGQLKWLSEMRRSTGEIV